RANQLADEVSPDRLLRCTEDSVLAEATGRRDHRQLELGSHYRRHPERVVRLRRQSREPATHHLPHPLGDAELRDRDPSYPATFTALDGTAVHQVAEHLPHEE